VILKYQFTRTKGNKELTEKWFLFKQKTDKRLFLIQTGAYYKVAVDDITRAGFSEERAKYLTTTPTEESPETKIIEFDNRMDAEESAEKFFNTFFPKK